MKDSDPESCKTNLTSCMIMLKTGQDNLGRPQWVQVEETEHRAWGDQGSQSLQDRAPGRRELQRPQIPGVGPPLVLKHINPKSMYVRPREEASLRIRGTELNTHTGACVHHPDWTAPKSHGLGPWCCERGHPRLRTGPDLLRSYTRQTPKDPTISR